MSRKKQSKIVVSQESERSELLRNARASFSQATGRVGKDSRSQLSWLMDFVHLTAEKMKQLSSDEGVQLRYDLAYFAGSPAPWEAPSSEEIAALASELRSGIEHLMRTTRWTIKLPKNAEVERTLEPRPKWRAGRISLDGFQSIFTSNDFRTSFLLRATDAIEAEGTRINVCARKDCGRMFARHRRAKYCSAPCSQKERDTRFRSGLNAAERSERRHRYYKKRIEKLRGRAVASKVSKQNRRSTD